MSNEREIYGCSLDDLPCYTSSLIVVSKDYAFRGGKGCTQAEINYGMEFRLFATRFLS
jgi:hypothetical protein